MAKGKLRCYKCFVTLEHLKKEGIADYLVKIITDEKEEEYICPVCHQGYNG